MLPVQSIDFWWIVAVERVGMDRTDGAVEAVEGLGGRLTNFDERVAESLADGGHQAVNEGQHHLPGRGHHDLRETDAHSLSSIGLIGIESLLQNGDDLR